MKLSKEMKKSRKPFLKELELIEYLANKANYQLSLNWKEKLVVFPLTKDKIGPLKLQQETITSSDKSHCREISNCMFYDKDGVGVAAYLLVDEDDHICELDMWKGDDSIILEIPSMNKMLDIPVIDS